MRFDHYTIRRPGMNDMHDYFMLIENNRDRLEDFFPVTVAATKDADQTREHLSGIISKNSTRELFSFVITDDHTKSMVAYIIVKSIDWKVQKAELGYFADRHYEGRGIVTRALSMIIDYCFDVLKLQKLLIRTHESNTGSRKVAEKCGFRQEGVIRNDHRTTKGELMDLLYYGRTADDKFQPIN